MESNFCATTFDHNKKTNMWNQTNSIVFNGENPLITNNIISSKNPFYAPWSFGNGFEEEKYLEMALGLTFCHLIVSS
jgi:hypothetical protein